MLRSMILTSAVNPRGSAGEPAAFSIAEPESWPCGGDAERG